MMENQLTAAQCLQAGRAFAQAYNYEAALRAFGQGLKIDGNCNELERAFLSASHSLRLQVYRNVFVRRNGQYWGICELVAPAAQELFQLGKSFFFSGDYLWAIKFFGAALCHDSTNRCLLQYFSCCCNSTSEAVGVERLSQVPVIYSVANIAPKSADGIFRKAPYNEFKRRLGEAST